MTGVHDHDGASLRHYLNVFRRRKWLIAGVTVAIVAIAVGLSLRQQKLYAATAEVYLNSQDLSNSLTGTPNPTFSAAPDRIAQTQADLAHVPTVAARALRSAHVTARTPGELVDETSISILPNANILSFTITDRDPVLAVRLANAYANKYTGFERDLSTAAIQAAKTQLEAKIAQLQAAGDGGTTLTRTLEEKDRQLDTIAALQTTNAYVIKTATHSAQVQPRPTRNGILAFVLGLILGIGVAFLRETLDTRVRTAEEVGHRLGIPLLARIPYAKSRKAPNQLPMIQEPNSGEAEAYRALRTNIDFVTLDRKVKTLVVTSALEQEGKSTVASNLSVALALGGHRVVLVDLDLRRPTIGKIFGLEGMPGITEVALGRVSLDEALAPIALTDPEGASTEARANGHSSNGHTAIRGVLEVLPAGPLPPDPGEFMSTEALHGILDDLRARTDIVIIDAPPALSVSDPMTLSRYVDGVVLVARLNIVRRPMLAELHRLVDASPAHKLGYIVIGGTSSDYGGYAYYYSQQPYAPRVERERVG